MDPNATLAELRQMLGDYLAHIEAGGGDLHEEAAVRVAERFAALDGWLSAGGFPPAAWTPAGRER
jgi:hypothetical protein